MDISGSNYRILNSARSVIFTSTSSSATFNWLLGSGRTASSGSTVYVENGAYLVDNTWYIYVNGVTVTFASTLPTTPNLMGHLVGSGTPGAVLTAKDNLNQEVLRVTANNVVIRGVTINGNSYNQYQGAATGADYGYQHQYNQYSGDMGPYWWIGGIYLNGQYDLVEYSTIYNCREWGVYVEGSYSGCQNVVIHDIGWNGFTALSSPWNNIVVDRAFCINSEIYRCSDAGLDSQAQNTIFTGNYVHHICPNGVLNGIYQPHGSMDSYWAIAWEDGGYGNNGGTGSGTYALCTGNVVDYCSGEEGIIIFSG